MNKDLIYVHPMKLFMMIAFSDSLMFWLLFMEPYICLLDLHKLLSYTMFFKSSDDNLLFVTREMAYSYNTMVIFCYVLSLNLNICVCIDMVLMIKNPFTKQMTRMKPYLFFSFVGAVVAVAIQLLAKENDKVNQSIELFVFIIFATAGVISTFTAFQMVRKPGVSIEVRKLILSRHVGYTVLYLICNLFIAIRNFYFVFNINPDSFNNQWYVVVLGVLFYCQGILVALLRAFEPTFY